MFNFLIHKMLSSPLILFTIYCFINRKKTKRNRAWKLHITNNSEIHTPTRPV